MGIKGIYKEIGPGQRISMTKLALTTLEKADNPRPFRLAIDISIWQFQIQATRGGSNPAIRTLFFRLIRLLSLAIQPLFVFDGPNKPAFKRNKRAGGPRGAGQMVATSMAKRMIKLFGFAIHDAPGEAEAECAFLQREGVVDAVLSEDVDTIMFGCGKTLRSWTAEGKGNVPTHVTVYDAEDIAKGDSGLDREGMVLVALMSGGDYLPEGVPGCGIKVACEAARAGFGKELCGIKKANWKAGVQAWRERLRHEWDTNESGNFRTKHKSLAIPEDFPDMEILRYYTHPVVSTHATVERLKTNFPNKMTSPVDVVGLREFVGETFDWQYRGGAVNLVRKLAHGLLVQYLLQRSSEGKDYGDDTDLMAEEEGALITGIKSRRAHASTDETPELRVCFIPNDIVKLDLDREPIEEVEEHGRAGLALNSDDEFDGDAGEDEEGPKKTAKKPYDPEGPDLAWIPETLLKLGVPLTVEDWETKKRKKATKPASKKTAKSKGGMQAGALDKFFTVTKTVSVSVEKSAGSAEISITSTQASPPRSAMPPPPAPKARGRQPKKAPTKSQSDKPAAEINPWTLSGSQVSPKVTKCFSSSQPLSQKAPSSYEPILISSSPVAASPPRTSPIQTTPTRPKRQSPDLSRSPAPPQMSEIVATPPTISATRPFKRTKSGAGEALPIKNISSTQPPKPKSKQPPIQKSIKSCGRTTKNNTAAVTTNKPIHSIPIEFLSSDSDDNDDSDDELPSLSKLIPSKFSIPPPPQSPSGAKTGLRQSTAPPRIPSFSKDDDDDDIFMASPKPRSKPPPKPTSEPPQLQRFNSVPAPVRSTTTTAMKTSTFLSKTSYSCESSGSTATSTWKAKSHRFDAENLFGESDDEVGCGGGKRMGGEEEEEVECVDLTGDD
ncbi:hypothetical protein B0T21DRAFT_447223 [Apiosordaria backusii]|uniref:Uncharacterized protein n=1 Tax=Apiosordaria backusii TaxID=314023 RepID=A0AA40F050_9PEZI|nr:hypothetical protein B0T21DRAFT_447223 [Apiosordaria backusii]